MLIDLAGKKLKAQLIGHKGSNAAVAYRPGGAIRPTPMPSSAVVTALWICWLASSPPASLKSARTRTVFR